MPSHTCCQIVTCSVASPSWVSQREHRQGAVALLLGLLVTSQHTQSNDKAFLFCAQIYVVATSLVLAMTLVSVSQSWVSDKNCLYLAGLAPCTTPLWSERCRAGTGEGKGPYRGMSHWIGLAVMSDCSLCWFLRLMWEALLGKLNLYCLAAWHSSNNADCLLLDITEFSCTWLEN